MECVKCEIANEPPYHNHIHEEEQRDHICNYQPKYGKERPNVTPKSRGLLSVSIFLKTEAITQNTI